jgi:hypothetical protein
MEKNAVFAGEKWLRYRTEDQEQFFPIHSVFNKVINISTSQGLLSVAVEETGRSNAFLTISGKNVVCSPGLHCRVQDGILHFSDLTINFKNSAVWKGPVNKSCKYDSVKKENITAFKAVLDRKAPQQSAWRFITNDSLTGKWNGLNSIKEVKKKPHLAQNLIGLGCGLTPAGDDMLIGFLAAVNHCRKNKNITQALHAILPGLLNKTTDVSAQAVKNALNCDYHEYIQNCIRDLYQGGKEEVYISTSSLIKMGATSGSDIACGMYFALI